ncbi:hypothetical protein IPJ72_04495 [Candidatus Peregrinibacteria bacterium]|nr:MAG: hypothetical protein IPJ72_04495 [Candidatus Peregrinibacteria bacterium]
MNGPHLQPEEDLIPVVTLVSSDLMSGLLSDEIPSISEWHKKVIDHVRQQMESLANGSNIVVFETSQVMGNDRQALFINGRRALDIAQRLADAGRKEVERIIKEKNLKARRVAKIQVTGDQVIIPSSGDGMNDWRLNQGKKPNTADKSLALPLVIGDAKYRHAENIA